MATAATEVFDDLLSLEINIIVKPGMTARKMPDVGHALLDIFSDYDTWLCAFAPMLNEAWSKFRESDRGARRARAAPPDDWLVADGGLITALEVTALYEPEGKVSAADFDELRARARKAEEMYRLVVHHGFLRHDDSAIILKRIYRNCDQIKGILAGRGAGHGGTRAELGEAAAGGLSRTDARMADLRFTADEVLIVRKAWEVGTETVVMQTVAQLDGDIVTRVQEARMTAADKALHDLHREAVSNALEHWQFLVRTFVQITTTAARFFSR